MAEASLTRARAPLPPELRLKRNRTVALTLAFLVFLLDQATKWIVTYPLQLQFRREIEITSFFDLRWVENTGVSLGLLSAGSAIGRWLLVAMTAAIAIFVAAWLWREKRRDDSVALGLGAGRRARQYRRPDRLRLCRRLRRSAFRRVAAVFGLQCRRRSDYHRRAAFACPRAPDARWQDAQEGSLTMRIAHLALAGSAAALLAGCAGGGPFGRQGPDEFAVARNAPLVVPPDFALTPPRPGEAEAQRHRSARPGAPGPVRRPAAAQRGREQPAPGRPCRPRRSGRPLGRRRPADLGRQPRRPRPDHPAAAPGRRPGSVGNGAAIGPKVGPL